MTATPQREFNVRNPGEHLADSLLLAAIHRTMSTLRDILPKIHDHTNRHASEKAIEYLAEEAQTVRLRLESDCPHSCPR